MEVPIRIAFLMMLYIDTTMPCGSNLNYPQDYGEGTLYKLWANNRKASGKATIGKVVCKFSKVQYPTIKHPNI